MMIVIISFFYLIGEVGTDLPALGVEGILRDDLAIVMNKMHKKI